MSRFRVVVTDQVFPTTEVERGMIEAAGGTLHVANGSHEEVMAAARDADALLTTYFPLGASDIARLERCKAIARYGIGVDNIDLDAARVAGIAVTNVPDYCIEEVAVHTVALILAAVRKISIAVDIVREGGWGHAGLGGVRRLSSMTLGLLGYGQIARRVADIMRPLVANLVVHDPFVTDLGSDGRLVGLNELRDGADIVSIHCPLTPETRGLVNRDFLRGMKAGSYLVNTSRGPIVVLDDLLASLRDGHIAGAGLDVFDEEPPVAVDLASVRNLQVTPHSAFYSVEAIAESQRKAAGQVLKVLGGEVPDYPVSP